ncbi:MAG: hypothetical protein WC869_07320 [Phycisphaerae bacterium]|jgi:hypothetical protein
MSEQDTTPSPSPDRIVCAPSRDPIVRWFIVAGMLLGFALWTIYDHYIMGKYPNPTPYSLNPYMKYLFNHYVPYLLVPPGLVALYLGIRAATRRMVADSEGVGYLGGTRLAWGDIKRVDSTQLQSKGILDLHDAAGKRLRLDSWYLTNFRDLVAYVDKHLPTDVQDVK